MILDRLFTKRASLENPSTSLSNPDNWLFEAFGAMPAEAGVTVSERNVTQITAFWSAVNTISDTMGELPIKLVKEKKDGTTEKVTGHPSMPLLRLQPNSAMNAMVFKSTVQSHALTWGNGYVYIRRDRTGAPAELWPLMPHETVPVVESGQVYFDTVLDIGKTRLRSSEVLHIPALSRNGIAGMSIIAEQREVLGSIMAANKFGAKLFANGAKPGGLISYPGRLRDPEKVKAAIQRASSGDNALQTIVLADGAQYTPFGIPPDDAQFLQTREFGVDEIARMFRLPSHFLNKMGQATFNNLEMMGTHFAQYTMMPWIVRWEMELTRKLLTAEEIQRGLRYKVNVSALVRGDIKTRSEVYTKAITNGWMTRNEVRALEDMNPLEGLDDPLMPANLLVVGDEAPEPEDTPTQIEPEPVGDEPSSEEEDDEESDGDDAERSFVVLQALCQRLCNKEANAMRRIARKQYDAETLTDEIAAFYRNHQQLLVENLVIDPEFARQYCERHALAFVESDNVDDEILNWTTEGVTELVNKASEGL